MRDIAKPEVVNLGAPIAAVKAAMKKKSMCTQIETSTFFFRHLRDDR